MYLFYFFKPSQSLLYFIWQSYTRRSLFNLLFVRSRSVKSILAAIWPVTRAALSTTLLPPHSIHSTPHCWLLFPHHLVCCRLPRFCPNHSRKPAWWSPGCGPSRTSFGMAFIYQPHNWGQGNPCFWGQNYNIWITNTDCIFTWQIIIATKCIKLKLILITRSVFGQSHDRDGHGILSGLENFLFEFWPYWLAIGCLVLLSVTEQKSRWCKSRMLIAPLHVDQSDSLKLFYEYSHEPKVVLVG